jgi:hypothetical protein
MYPEVKIKIENGRLGRIVPSPDGVCGLIVVGVALPAVPLYTGKQIFSLKEAENLGINQAYDTANGTQTWRQIADFYTFGQEGAELWIYLVQEVKKMAELLDKASLINSANQLLETADGRIRILGVSLNRLPSYSPVLNGGMDEDVLQAVEKAHQLAEGWKLTFSPFVCVIDAVKMNDDLSTLTDLTNLTFSNSAVCAWSLNGKNGAIGATLGWLSNLKTVEKVSKRALGAVTLNASLTNGKNIREISSGAIKALANKGYLTLCKQQNQKGGLYFAGDSTATVVSDDFSSIARNRVMNKVIEIVYNTYAKELDKEVAIQEDGKIAAVVINYLQSAIIRALNLQLIETGEASFVDAFIDPNQVILSTDSLRISVNVTPMGYTSVINITLGYRNPANK